MQVSTEIFLKTLFDGVDEKNYIDIRTFKLVYDGKEKKDKLKLVENYFERIKDIDRLLKLLKEPHFENLNIHYGVCPRYRERGKEEDVKFLQAFWVDKDCRRKGKPYLPTKDVGLQQINQFKLPPSIIIDSGQGYQLLWLLSKIINIKDGITVSKLRGVLAGLIRALDGDPAAKDLCHLLRLPNTLNFKPDHNGGLPVEVIKFEPNIKYDLSKFKEFYLKQEEKVLGKVATEKEKIRGWIRNPDNIVLPDKFQRLLKSDEKLKATWDGERTDFTDPSRSAYSMSLAGLLVNYHTFTDEEIIKAMIIQPTGKLKENTPQYLIHTLKTAKSNLTSKFKKRASFDPEPYAEMVFNDFHFKTDESKRFYIYDSRNGVYRDKAEIYIRYWLRKKYLAKGDYSIHKVNEIVTHIRDLALQDVVESGVESLEEMMPSLNLIPFANCIYDIDADEQIKYSPDYFFTTKWKVRYSPQAGGCPTIDKIFHEIVRSEDVITLYELAAYCMWRAYPYPKMFFFYGDGGNGKSAYSNILTRLIGSRNISTETTNSLQTSRFASGNLYDKFVNIATEMEYTVLRNTTYLKQLTGEDLIRKEQKFGDVFNYYNYAKIVFACNAIPETVDTTFAWPRRVFLLEFPNKFIIGKNADPNLVRDLPQEEIEGLALWSIIKLKELRERKFVFTRHESTEKVAKKYKNLSNPLTKFIEDYCKKDYRREIFVDEFCEKYIEFLEEKKLRVITENAIQRGMTRLGYKSKIIKQGDKRASAYLGLKWKDNDLDEAVEESKKIFSSKKNR